MPRECIDLLERHPAFLSLIVEETQLDRLRDLGKKREVLSGAVEAGPERISAAGPDLQVRHALRSRPPHNRAHRGSRAQGCRLARTRFGRPRPAPAHAAQRRGGAAPKSSTRGTTRAWTRGDGPPPPRRNCAT